MVCVCLSHRLGGVGSKVDMIDAAVMRNVAAPDTLQALARAGGGGAGDISILPVWGTTSVLVLAPGEQALGNTMGEVVSHW